MPGWTAALPYIVGGITSLYGSSQQASALRDAANRSGDLLPANAGGFFGPNGESMTNFRGNVYSNLGNYAGPNAFLQQLSSQMLGGAMNNNMPFDVRRSLGRYTGSTLNNVAPGTEGLSGIQGLLGNLGNQGYDQLQQLFGQGLQTDLAGQAFAGSQQALSDATMGGDMARDRTLEQLRAQALPQQERAVQSQLDGLFGSGRLGTTGGQNMIGRLAESQDQQDLGFQLAANQEGRNFTNQALGQATGLAGMGGQLNRLQSSLFDDAFNRFGRTSELNQDLDQNIFERMLASNQANMDYAQRDFNLQTGFDQYGLGRQNQQLNTGLQSLGGMSGIQGTMLQGYQAALQRAIAQSNASIGVGSNLAGLSENPNFGSNAFQGIGNALLNNSEGIGDWLSGLFSGGGGGDAEPASTGSIWT